MSVPYRLATAALSLLLGCADRQALPAEPAGLDTTAAKSAIQAQMRAMAAAATAGDIEAVVGLYTTDAYLREPGFSARGADSIRAVLGGAFTAVEILELIPEPEHYVFSGSDRVVEFAAYRERIRDRASGAETLCDCRYAAEWVRGADGQWRIGYLLTGPK
jgi:ketosteroid isomerase-like protein